MSWRTVEWKHYSPPHEGINILDESLNQVREYAVPAAERRQTVATAEGRGLNSRSMSRAERRQNLPPLRGSSAVRYCLPRPSAQATVWRRSAA